jgi:hypothetical protein
MGLNMGFNEKDYTNWCGQECLAESDFHRPIDFISLSFFPNIAAVVAAPILKECVL